MHMLIAAHRRHSTLPCVHCAAQQPLFKSDGVNNHLALHANSLSQMYGEMLSRASGRYSTVNKKAFPLLK